MQSATRNHGEPRNGQAAEVPLHDGADGWNAPRLDSLDTLDLRALPDIFHTFVQTTRMPMLVTDPSRPDNPVAFANDAFLRLTGYTIDEVRGRNCRFLQGPDTDPAAVAAIRQAVAAQQQIDIEILNYRKNREPFWNALYITPIRAEDGHVIAFFASQLDVSRRREAEAALYREQHMAAVGQLTAGVAHDFNNHLAIIVGRLDELSEHEADPAQRARVAAVLAAAERASTLTQQLLAFARRQKLSARTVRLNELVENLLALVRPVLGSGIDLQLDLDPALHAAQVDPVQTETALTNVLFNARDAMESGGRITIAAANAAVGEADRPFHSHIDAGRYVVLSVTDTGAGMSKETLQRAVEPFYTTKPVGRGSGMGLSMVHGFMRQSNGHLSLYSEPGCGTTVRLYFPAVDSAAPGAAAVPVAEQATRQAETILIVEDDPDVRDMVYDLLDDFGFSLVTAGSGPAALRLLEDPATPAIDLLLTDVVMPGGIDGIELARRAQAARPGLKVLVTSGFQALTVRHNYPLIAKPYRRAEMVRRIRAVLDGEAEPDGGAA
jgi:PAS domain S-box-containing protein